jgi:hypothetical protein
MFFTELDAEENSLSIGKKPAQLFKKPWTVAYFLVSLVTVFNSVKRNVAAKPLPAAVGVVCVVCVLCVGIIKLDPPTHRTHRTHSAVTEELSDFLAASAPRLGERCTE